MAVDQEIDGTQPSSASRRREKAEARGGGGTRRGTASATPVIPGQKGKVHERGQSKGISEMQQGRRMVDRAAHEPPGKVAAGEEEDELGGVDSGLSFAIPWTGMSMATRRTFWYPLIWPGKLQSPAMHVGGAALVRFRGELQRE